MYIDIVSFSYWFLNTISLNIYAQNYLFSIEEFKRAPILSDESGLISMAFGKIQEGGELETHSNRIPSNAIKRSAEPRQSE